MHHQRFEEELNREKEKAKARKHEESKVVCSKCKLGTGDNLLLCDTPSLFDDPARGVPFHGFHTTCLDTPLEIIPEGNWFCPLCVPPRLPSPTSTISSTIAPMSIVDQHTSNALDPSPTSNQPDPGTDGPHADAAAQVTEPKGKAADLAPNEIGSTCSDPPILVESWSRSLMTTSEEKEGSEKEQEILREATVSGVAGEQAAGKSNVLSDSIPIHDGAADEQQKQGQHEGEEEEKEAEQDWSTDEEHDQDLFINNKLENLIADMLADHYRRLQDFRNRVCSHFSYTCSVKR